MRRLTWLMVFAVLLAWSASALAVSDSRAQLQQEMRLIEMGLEIIEEVPTGVEPLEFDSPDEVAAILASRMFRNRGVERTDGEGDASVIEASSTIITTDTLHWNYVCNPVWGTRFNLWADIHIAWNGSYSWIDAVRNVRVGLTGLHPFMRLVNTYTGAYVYQSDQKARVTGGGTLEYYFLIQGIFTYYSEPAWLIAYYTLSSTGRLP